MSRIRATSENNIAIVYGDDPMGMHGRFVQLQHPQLGKDYNDFIFFAVDDRLGIETNDTPLKLSRRGGSDWFEDSITKVFKYYGISDDILQQVLNLEQ